MYAPGLALLPLDPADDEVTVDRGIAFHFTLVETAVQLSNVAVAQEPRASLPPATHGGGPPSHLVDHVQIKRRGLVVAEYTRAPS